MSFFLNTLQKVVLTVTPWGIAILLGLLFSLIFTPICRNLAIKCGMVDKPSERRVNKKPIPRAGGLAVGVAFILSSLLLLNILPENFYSAEFVVTWKRLMILGGVLMLVGLIDDKFSMNPRLKFLFQIAVAVAVVFWCKLSFTGLPILSWMPNWLIMGLTIFWVAGAVNSFNLIDGLDGLASGLAVIATVGMAGVMWFVGAPNAMLVYLVLTGACLGFLFYNFNPASVFLGDTGSMFIGFMISTLPLLTRYSSSSSTNYGESLIAVLVVPLLMMGVPVCDTALAILRRSVRAFLSKEENGADEGNRYVMQPDLNHLHHRLMDFFKSQRKAVLILYALAIFFGFAGLAFVIWQDRAVAVFIMIFLVASVVLVNDMKRVELWDMGRLIDFVVHNTGAKNRPKRSRLIMTLFMVADVIMLLIMFLLTHLLLNIPVTIATTLHSHIAIWVIPTFALLIYFRIYKTYWARAQVSNYLRLVISVVGGVLISTAIICFMEYPRTKFLSFVCLYTLLVIFALLVVRFIRPVVRDCIYLINVNKLCADNQAERVLVFGAGLRYRTFRRELVRNASKSTRVIVGLLDDDVCLQGLFIGGQRVYGGLNVAEKVVGKLRVDTVVVACQLSSERLAEVLACLKPLKVKVILWQIEENVLCKGE